MLARPLQNLVDVGWGGGGKWWWDLNSDAAFFLFCLFSKGQSTSKMPLESNQILRPHFSNYQTDPNPLRWGSWPPEVVFKIKTIWSSPLAFEYLQVFLKRMCAFSPWTGCGLKDSRWIPLLMVSLTCHCLQWCEDACANSWACQAAW